jgi:hypothetical protein
VSTPHHPEMVRDLGNAARAIATARAALLSARARAKTDAGREQLDDLLSALRLVSSNESARFCDGRLGRIWALEHDARQCEECGSWKPGSAYPGGKANGPTCGSCKGAR